MYHRAVYGKSQIPNNSRTTRNIAKELNDLVRKIGITNKFILMGHSFGGLSAQQYAKMYPNKIKGLILIDSTSYNFNELYTLESIFYGVKALVYGLPISVLVIIGIHCSIGYTFEFGFSLPWMSILFVIVVIFLIVGSAMLYSISKLKNENIIV